MIEMSSKKISGHRRRYVSPQFKDKVRDRDLWTCRMCLRGVDELDEQLEVHHIRPIKIGGRDRFNNLISLCRICHSGVHYDEDSVKFWIQPLREYVRLLKKTGKHMALIDVINSIKCEENKKNDTEEERNDTTGSSQTARNLYA